MKQRFRSGFRVPGARFGSPEPGLPLNQLLERLADGLHADQFDTCRDVVRGTVAIGDDAAVEAHLRRLADPQRGLGDAAHLPGKPDLAKTAAAHESVDCAG